MQDMTFQVTKYKKIVINTYIIYGLGLYRRLEMPDTNSSFDLDRFVKRTSEKKGYAQGIRYYFRKIRNNPAVINSEYYDIVKKFDLALKDLIKDDSSTALVELIELFPDFYKDGELPESFVLEGLTVAFDNISEYLMHLRSLYNLDYYL